MSELPTIRQLEYAIAVADHRHFGRAAEAANVSQPGLSSQVQELERRLGVELFERGPRQVLLTPAGARVVAAARRIVLATHDLVADAAARAGTVSGRLRVGAIPTMAPYLLPTLVRTVQTAWPGVEPELLELQTTPLADAVARGEVDLGLVATPYDLGSLHVAEVASEPFVLALPEAHPLAATDAPVALDALDDLPVLLLPEGHCLRAHALATCEIAGRVSHGEVHHASLTTLVQMVMAGTGATLLPASAVPVEARPGSGVAVRPIAGSPPGRTAALVWRDADPRADRFETLVAPLSTAIAQLVESTGTATRPSPAR